MFKPFQRVSGINSVWHKLLWWFLLIVYSLCKFELLDCLCMVFLLDHLPPISEVINGDTKVVTEFKRNEEGKLLKVVIT